MTNMKYHQPNPRLLEGFPFFITLLGTMALLLSPSPAAAQFTETNPGLPE